ARDADPADFHGSETNRQRSKMCCCLIRVDPLNPRPPRTPCLVQPRRGQRPVCPCGTRAFTTRGTAFPSRPSAPVHALLLPSLLVLQPAADRPAGGPFELADGDRVVLLGNTLIEREQRYGYWEAALAARFPRRAVQFRNLGWSGDTVFGEARAGFGSAADGFRN